MKDFQKEEVKYILSAGQAHTSSPQRTWWLEEIKKEKKTAPGQSLALTLVPWDAFLEQALLGSRVSGYQ